MAATVREVARSCVEVTNATDIAHESALEGQLKVKAAITKINTLGADVEKAKNIISQVQSDVTDIILYPIKNCFDFFFIPFFVFN